MQKVCQHSSIYLVNKGSFTLRCKQDTEIVHIRVSIGPRSRQTLVDWVEMG